jgi:hypothetical protein
MRGRSEFLVALFFAVAACHAGQRDQCRAAEKAAASAWSEYDTARLAFWNEMGRQIDEVFWEDQTQNIELSRALGRSFEIGRGPVNAAQRTAADFQVAAAWTAAQAVPNPDLWSQAIAANDAFKHAKLLGPTVANPPRLQIPDARMKAKYAAAMQASRFAWDSCREFGP